MNQHWTKSAFAVAFLGSFLALALTACHKRSSIDVVRNGLLAVDTRKTIGEAFSAYPYFRDVQWREATSGGQTDVFAVARFDSERVFADIPPAYRATFQQNKSPIVDALSAVEFEFAFRIVDPNKTIFYRRLTVTQTKDGNKASGETPPEGQQAVLKEVYDGRYPTYAERALGLRQPGDYH